IADPRTDRSDHRLDLGVGEHLVDPVFLRVDHLAAQRQDRLVDPVSGLDRRPPCGVALDEEGLTPFRIVYMKNGELARQRGALEGALSPRELPRLTGCLPRVP